MSEAFYAGHSFKWTNKFLNAIPKGQRYKRSIAFGIATCIHHQYIYTKQTVFKLSNKKLILFGVQSRFLKPYLTLFQKADLIEYFIKQGNSPIIQLLLLPSSYYTISNKNINQYLIKDAPPLQSIGTLLQSRGDYSNVEVANGNLKQGKEGREEEKQGGEASKGKEVRKGRKQAKEGCSVGERRGYDL